MTDLDEIALMLRESLSLCLAPHPERPMLLQNLVIIFQDRFAKTAIGEVASMFGEFLMLYLI